jgi:16S rRNA (cytidine1402-2'-O)-methyltransferase
LVESLDPFNHLCKNLNISTNAKIIDYGNYDQDDKIKDYIDILKSGTDVLVLSDDGTAGIVDPGGVLLRVARQEGIPVKVMPGPNSIIPSLVLSQFGYRFYFHGPSFDNDERRRSFRQLANYEFPMIFFVTNDYLGNFISDAKEFFGGERKVSVASNMTKPNEFIVYTTIDELHTYWHNGKMNTHITLTIEGKPPHQ